MGKQGQSSKQSDAKDITPTADALNFQISTRRSGRLRTVKVFVYSNPEVLRADAEKWSASQYNEDRITKDTLSIAHRFERIRVDNDTSHNVIGIIRLDKDYLKTGIITHEVAHIALWIYQLDNKNTLTTEDIENEEVFCHILGDLSAKLVNKLYEKKLL